MYQFAYTMWGVPLGIEELFFTFLVGGIGSVIHEVIFRKEYKIGKNKHRHLTTIGTIIFIAVVLILLKHVGINTLWASIMVLIVASLIIATIERGLFRDMVYSSLLMLVIALVVYGTLLKIFPEFIKLFPN